MARKLRIHQGVFIALTKNDMAETWYPAKYLYTTSLCWLLLNTFILHKKKEKNPRVCAAGCVRQQEREDGGGDGQVREGNNWGKLQHFCCTPYRQHLMRQEFSL